jgi:hypothetical protein
MIFPGSIPFTGVPRDGPGVGFPSSSSTLLLMLSEMDFWMGNSAMVTVARQAGGMFMAGNWTEVESQPLVVKSGANWTGGNGAASLMVLYQIWHATA